MKNLTVICRFLVLAAAGFALVQDIGAQPFAYNDGDMLVGFRKRSPFSTPYELVANAGPVTNYLSAAPGARFTITNFTKAQITNAFGDLTDLSWAVSCCTAYGLPGIDSDTLWVCRARKTLGTQTAPYNRVSSFGAAPVVSKISTIGNDAVAFSRSVGSNEFNTVTAVQEDAGSPLALSNEMGTSGNYANTFQANAENTTSNNFATPVRSDFYQLMPNGDLDPITGQTTGPAAYLGYFELAPDGTLTYTAAGGTVAPPPPPPVLSVARSNLLNTVSFTSTNGAIYTLHFTNAAGLGAPLTAWPALPGPLTGNGAIMSFQDSTSDAMRFYRVEAH